VKRVGVWSMAGRAWGVSSILAGLVLSVLGSAALLSLVREQLHFLCSFAVMGDEPGSFVCADGISYLGTVVFTLGLNLVFAIVGIAALLKGGAFGWRMLAAAAVLPLAVFSWSTWYATATRSSDAAPGANYWVAPLLAVTIVLAAAVLVLLAAAFIRAGAPARARALSLTALILATLLLVVAWFVQPGSAAAVAMALGLLGASFAAFFRKHAQPAA
jgi:hypothetical protein